MQYPEDDTDFREVTIRSVTRDTKGGYAFGDDGGWWLHCGDNCPVEPVIGQTARLYGKGLGYSIRGLFIDGVKVWYRTEAEEKEYREIESYGADAADWLDRWDNGRGVWSIEMGGLGPGYEQAIQITAAEVVRWFISDKTDASRWTESDEWRADRERMEKAAFENEVIKQLGLSGAQFGAAVSLASFLYKNGPRAMMADPQVKDRHIQVSKSFPSGGSAA